MIARKIWLRRNEFVFKDSFLHPSLVVQQSRQLLVDFKEVQSKNIRQITNNSSQVCKWEPPSEGFYKVNWDAAINKSMGKIGIGITTRDQEGNV